jgi:ketosteroid isomerase-like protein
VASRNVEIVRRGFEAMSAGRIDTVTALAHSDVELRPLLANIEGEVYRGHEGIRRWFSQFTDTFEDFTIELGELEDLDDHVLVAGRIHARGKGSGTPIDQPSVWVITMRDGKATRIQIFNDKTTALKAAGLAQKAPPDPSISSEKVEIVRQIFDAVAQRDSATILGLYHPDVELDISHTESAELFGHSVYRGYEGLRNYDREWREAFENVETDCEELFEAGEQVVSVARYRMRGRVSGIEVPGPAQGGLWTIRDGKVARVVWFNTREEALHAALSR